MTFKRTMHKVGMSLKKNSPGIFTAIGIVGLGATAVLAYKSRTKVEAVVVGIEEARESGEEINKVTVAKDLTEALYQPVLVGAASITCILLAQKIQSNRIKVLAGTLAIEQARNIWFESKYRKEHGEEAYEKFISPTEEITNIGLDKKGKEKITVQQVKKDIDQTIGQWYDESQEYYSDDHVYNIAHIDAVNDRMQTLLFQRGSLLLNEVREALGFERIRAGALLGWTTSDSFEIQKIVTMMEEEDEENALANPELKEQIYVTWTKPRYIYDDVEFNGRYSVY
jgi:hypothetical protein